MRGGARRRHPRRDGVRARDGRRFTELDPPRRLVFTFGWEGNAPGEPLAPGSTVVEVSLTSDGGDTLLVLRHSEMPDTHAEDHTKGWGYFVGERLPDAIARGS